MAMRTLSVVSLLHFLLLNANAQLDDAIPLTEDEIVFPYVPPICEEHVPLLFAFSDKRCGCFWQPEDGLQDGSQATPCTTGPVGLEPNGRVACRDLSPTSSECFIQCDDEYTLVEGNKCVFDDGNGIKDCGCGAPLSFAYPDKPCACVTSLDEGSPGKQCVDPPSGHGKGLCRTFTKSECFTDCGEGRKWGCNGCQPDKRFQCPSGQFLYSSGLPFCMCQPNRADSYGVECPDPVGGHGKAACSHGNPTECTFVCDDGYRIQGDKCVHGAPGSGAAKTCQPHVPLMHSFSDKACGCFETPEIASPGTRCLGPPGQEQLGACRNATASECFIKCDDSYKLNSEETNCVLNRTDATFYYEDCPHHLPGRYLTADPVLGCVCQREPSDQWCQHPTGGGKGSCFHNADLSVVECRPECPEGKVAVENNCIPEYVDKFTSECEEGEVLNATDGGCVCQPISTATATGSTCWPPTTAGTGQGKCTMRYDGTQATCSIECNASLQPNDCKDDCFAALAAQSA